METTWDTVGFPLPSACRKPPTSSGAQVATVEDVVYADVLSDFSFASWATSCFIRRQYELLSKHGFSAKLLQEDQRLVLEDNAHLLQLTLYPKVCHTQAIGQAHSWHPTKLLKDERTTAVLAMDTLRDPEMPTGIFLAVWNCQIITIKALYDLHHLVHAYLRQPGTNLWLLAG